MTIKDIKYLICQEAIPQVVQNEAFMKAKSLILEGWEVEVIVSQKSIRVDYYGDNSAYEGMFNFKFVPIR